MKPFLNLAAALTGFLGAAWLAFPEAMLARWGEPHPDPITIYMGRRYGALFLGYTAILWMVRGSAPSQTLRAILAGGATVTIAIGIVSLVGVLSGVIGPLAWSAAAVEALLAAVFIYYYLRTRSGDRP